MKFGDPILTSELSGSIGGITASSARGGVGYFRVRARPGNPRSSNQSRVRLILTTLAAAWASTLTQAERLAWAAIAPATSSGIDVYVKANAQILLAGQARQDTAPSSVSLAANPLTSISLDVSDEAIKFTNTDFADDLYVNIYAQLTPQEPSQLSQKGHTTYLGTVNLAAAAAQSLSVTAFPGLANAVAGDIVYVRFVQFNVDGTVAQEQIERLTVVA